MVAKSAESHRQVGVLEDFAVISCYGPADSADPAWVADRLREGEGLADTPTALVGDFNLVWESTGGGAHGNLRQRWHDALQNFEGPLDHLDPDTERVVPTTRHYPRNGVGRKSPPDARVDFLEVRCPTAQLR